ncbi:VaFE repeat-containing surface-anchored protein [Trueperella pyogenes]|uniref:VaFE repeat-containing surface-anchored protein n=1 Tax=Trueperella pyogenes TaxID=1661 RepID=UPI00345DEFAD
MSNIDTAGVKRRRAATIVAIFTLLFTLLIPTGVQASPSPAPAKGLEVMGVNPFSPLRLGPWKVKTSVIDGVAIEDVPIWCINARYSDPGPNEMLSIATLTDSYKWGPPELDLETPQAAWLLAKYESSGDNTVIAALGYLLHVNFESPRGNYKAQATVDTLVTQVRAQLPQVDTLAQQMVVEARNSAVIGYEKGGATGEGQRTGEINDIGVHPDNGGTWVSGVPVTVTLEGPAVFEATGTNVWNGTTANGPITLKWRSTGNGEVTYQSQYKTPARRTLTKFGSDGTVQDMISYGNRPDNDPVEVTTSGPSWRVIFDFQPLGTSNVVKISDDGTFTDTLTAAADPTYGDGKWLELEAADAAARGINAGVVPVVYRVRAFEAGPTPPTQADTVPEGAKQIGEDQLITAAGPGDIQATFTGAQSGFATVVWEVRKSDQPQALQELVHADWADGYGLDEETVSVRFPVEIDSAASIRSTKSGTYLVDDLFVTGFPADHPQFAGSGRFGADTGELTQSLLFFPQDLEVIEANKANAEVIGKVSLPAKNGFYPSVGSTEFKVKLDESGKALPGTYVFVTEFAGDDRVQPLATSVEDVTEQYTITPEPGIGTTLMYEDERGPVPGYGKRTLTDVVSFTNLEPGKEYELTGTLMDKETGKPLVDGDGKEITSKAVFTPDTPNGSVEVAFEVDASLFAGKTTVAFETLYRDGREIAVHADIQDKNQTLPFEPGPKLKTTATDKADGDKIVPAEPGQVIVDKVCDENKSLKPGTEYEIITALMADDGKPVLDANGQPVTVTTKFTPQAADECASVEIPFDASKLGGRKVVVFEEVRHEGDTVGVHHDLQDADQTVKVEAKDDDGGSAGQGLAFTGASIAGLGVLGVIVAGFGVYLTKRRRA